MLYDCFGLLLRVVVFFPRYLSGKCQKNLSKTQNQAPKGRTGHRISTAFQTAPPTRADERPQDLGSKTEEVDAKMVFGRGSPAACGGGTGGVLVGGALVLFLFF